MLGSIGMFNLLRRITRTIYTNTLSFFFLKWYVPNVSVSYIFVAVFFRYYQGSILLSNVILWCSASPRRSSSLKKPWIKWAHLGIFLGTEKPTLGTSLYGFYHWIATSVAKFSCPPKKMLKLSSVISRNHLNIEIRKSTMFLFSCLTIGL